MKYNRYNIEDLQVLKKLKSSYENSNGRHFCGNVQCTRCPFEGGYCSTANRKSRYNKVCERILSLTTTKRTEFKVGDKVWHREFGWGKVTRFRDVSTYKVIVGFKYTEHTFTPDGRGDLQSPRTLFFEEIPVPPSALFAIDEPELKEMTMKEVEDKLSLVPGTLRIKK